MAITAMAFPIVAGKKDKWLQMIEQINTTWRAQAQASRKAAGVHERTFLQETPMGDLVIVTLEADDVETAMGRLMSQDDDFSRWMSGHLAEIHGFDLTAGPPPAPPRLVFDSQG